MSSAETSLRLYAGFQLGTGPQRPRMTEREPRPADPVVVPISTAVSIEATIGRILEAPQLAGESVQQSFDAKERAIHELIDTLAPDACARLHRALSGEEHENILRRLSAERRRRVLDHLQLAARPRRCA